MEIDPPTPGCCSPRRLQTHGEVRKANGLTVADGGHRAARLINPSRRPLSIRHCDATPAAASSSRRGCSAASQKKKKSSRNDRVASVARTYNESNGAGETCHLPARARVGNEWRISWGLGCGSVAWPGQGGGNVTSRRRCRRCSPSPRWLRRPLHAGRSSGGCLNWCSRRETWQRWTWTGPARPSVRTTTSPPRFFCRPACFVF